MRGEPVSQPVAGSPPVPYAPAVTWVVALSTIVAQAIRLNNILIISGNFTVGGAGGNNLLTIPLPSGFSAKIKSTGTVVEDGATGSIAIVAAAGATSLVSATNATSIPGSTYAFQAIVTVA